MYPKQKNQTPHKSKPSIVGKKIAGVMAVMGTASVVSILIGVIRLKILAVLLGPAGIGIYGMFLAVQNAGVALFGLGFNSSGIRQVAKACKNPKHLSNVRWALIVGNLLLGIIACCAIWILRNQIAVMIFSDTNHSTEIGILGIGVLVSLLAGAQLAVLQGLRLIHVVANYKIFGTLITSVCGIAIVYYHGTGGIIAMVLLIPVGNIAVVWALSARRIPRLNRLDPTTLPPVWGKSYTLGLTFMGTTSINTLSLIAIQALILRYGSQSEVGLFQAVFTLSVHYIGFLYLASQADYYPRLTAASDQPRRIRHMVNKQSEIGLLIAAPILILIVALSDWLLPFLYSATFLPAVELQRLWVLGDILTVPTIFCAYVLIGLNKGHLFFVTKLIGGVIYVGLVLIMYKIGYGLNGVAIAKVLMEVLILITITMIVSKLTGFYWHPQIIVLTLLIVLSVAGISLLAMVYPLIANGAGIVLAAGFGIIAVQRIYGSAKLLS